MMILAIDPGPQQSAFVLWSASVSSNHLLRMAILDNEAMFHLFKGWPLVVPDIVVGEMVACYGMAVGREVFETCLQIGRFKAVWELACRRFELAYRRDIKLHHCNSARAKDANVAQALRDKYGPVGTKKHPGPLFGIKSHLWAALAVATYAAETRFWEKKPAA